jgi:hypothetical protein
MRATIREGTFALYSAVKSSMEAIDTEDEHAPQDGTRRMVQIAWPGMITRWSESEIANGKPLVRIWKDNAHLVDLQ